MIAVHEAEKIISQNVRVFPTAASPLHQALGQVLREDIFADRDLPPFHRVAMDGIAISFASWQGGNSTFPVEGILKAGQAPFPLRNKNGCIEVMTGAVLPPESDCVVQVENIRLTDNTAKLMDGIRLRPMQNVHEKASDEKAEALLISQGCLLNSTHIAVAASVGKSTLRVGRQPRIAIIATGDELVEIDTHPQAHQIRLSNSHALQAALHQHHFQKISLFHLHDDRTQLTERLREILDRFEVLILSGGVSMGKFDYVPAVLAELGVAPLFHKIRQQPGKPFWFGKGSKGQPVFALPGNPVSALVCFYRYVGPELERALGLTDPRKEQAALDKSIDFEKPFSYFLPVKLHTDSRGRLMAEPVPTNGSGDYASLVKSDGFVELDAETNHFPGGTVVNLFRWR